MKFLQICVIALSTGIFITSCNNNPQCPPAAADSAAAKTTTPSDGMGAAAATIPADTADNTNGASTRTGAGYERESQTTKHGTGREQGMTRNDTLAASKAANANGAKKRAGNFTNGSPN